MSGRKTITVEELRRDLPEVLGNVLGLGQEYNITKNGEHFAVLAPVTDPGVIERLMDRLPDGMKPELV